METSNDIYTYQDQTIGDADLIGYSVEATDGSIGKIDDATNEVGGSYIVVDTGPWIFGKHVLLPAGVVQSIDHEDKTVYVNRTKDEIKDSPEWDDERKADEYVPFRRWDVLLDARLARLETERRPGKPGRRFFVFSPLAEEAGNA